MKFDNLIYSKKFIIKMHLKEKNEIFNSDLNMYNG